MPWLTHSTYPSSQAPSSIAFYSRPSRPKCLNRLNLLQAPELNLKPYLQTPKPLNPRPASAEWATEAAWKRGAYPDPRAVARCFVVTLSSYLGIFSTKQLITKRVPQFRVWRGQASGFRCHGNVKACRLGHLSRNSNSW